jgi:hypothetical protein
MSSSFSRTGFASLVARDYGRLPLLKPVKGAILPSKAAGTSRMSVETKHRLSAVD